MPWFPLYALEMLGDGDFISWSLEERGCWITLSARCWADGSIPEDTERMAKLCGCDAQAMLKYWAGIANKFEKSETSGRLISRRIEEERQKAIEKAEKICGRAKAGAAARWLKEKGEMPKQCLSTNQAMLVDATSPSPSPLPKSTNPLPPTGAGNPPAVAGQDQEKKAPRKPVWTKSHSDEVVKATQAIREIWPTPESGAFQPDRKTPVPGVSPSEVACRLAEIQGQGADLQICVAIAQRTVTEWKTQGKWIKAPQHFFGSSKDAPWKAYYQAHMTNLRLQEVAS
jgi:uncharacterized protein YdaU (DUF1376 family)